MSRLLAHWLQSLSLVLAAVGSLSLGVRAQSCAEYENAFRWVGFQPADHAVTGVAADGELFAMLKGTAGFELFRLPPNEGPEWLATVAAVDSVARASFHDGHLYVADGANIVVYDLANPSAPAQVGLLSFAEGRVSALTWTTDRLVAGRSGIGISIIDCTQPDDLQVDATLPLPPLGALDVSGRDDYVAVAGGDTLFTVDCSVPVLPQIRSRFELVDRAHVVTWVDSYVYAAGPAFGIQIVDLTDPDAPVAGTLLMYGRPRDMLVTGNRLYCSEYHLQVIDVTNPAGPAYLGFTFLPSGAYLPPDTGGQEMAVLGDLLLLADGLAGVQGFLGVLADPVSVVSEWQGGEQADDLAVCGSLAVVARPGAGQTALIDFTGGNLVELPTRLRPASAVAAAAPLVYLVSTTGSLEIFDLTNPSTPVTVSSLPLGVTAQSCALAAGHLFVAAGDDGVLPVDVSNPVSPFLRPVVDTPGFARRLAIVGGVAFVADGSAGLTTIDVGDPGAATVIASAPTPGGEARGISVAYNRAFVAANEAGIFEFDVTNAAAPNVTNQIPAASSALEVVGSGGMLYVADRRLGLIVADARYQNDLYFMGEVMNIYSNPVRVRIAGTGVLLLNGSGDLYLAPQACSALTPNLLASFSASAVAGRVSLSWCTLADGDGEFRVTARLQNREWEVPWTRLGDGFYAANDDRPALAAGGTVTYTLSWRPTGGAWEILTARVVQLPSPLTVLLPPHPNPFNPRVTVAFTLERSQKVSLTVHDVAGRLVTRLASGAFPAGISELTWDGQDQRGHLLPSGTYFVRLQAGDRSLTERVTLVR